MSDLVQFFENRLQEIEAYLNLLDDIEKQVQSGPPQLGTSGSVITVQQQRILYSSVYLQLYNLVEATVTRCLEAMTEAVAEKGLWRPGELSENLRKEWVRAIARTQEELNSQNRLETALILFNHLTQSLPINDFEITKGSSGNWDDKEIEDISDRLGLKLTIPPTIYKNVKKFIRNDQGVLEVIRKLRNDLAHGKLSFEECGNGVTVSDMRNFAEWTSQYLREVVNSFKLAIDAYEFLLPQHRPQNKVSST